MKFGKSLRNEIAKALSAWENEFISYKELKKQLNLIAQQAAGERIGFITLLDSELEKVNKFFIEKEEEYIIRGKELKERVANLESIGDRTQVKLDILEFHREMVLLLQYSVLNFAGKSLSLSYYNIEYVAYHVPVLDPRSGTICFSGLLKIVKKHNKKTGISISLAFMPMVLQQPFFITDLICKLLKECEVMLNQLFLGNNGQQLRPKMGRPGFNSARVCPQIRQCTPGGIISPETCACYNE
ncbi:SPX domain-containing protein 1 [Actinidia rufa]|uniref:SPX domain-containing protein 1 n=1 Tax=Actinidia rufa TaxID=165716 RepID=A0A7J0FE70_9ERIC|nr:SPX domain-containing protein 1 [Actinidia rufa]